MSYKLHFNASRDPEFGQVMNYGAVCGSDIWQGKYGINDLRHSTGDPLKFLVEYERWKAGEVVGYGHGVCKRCLKHVEKLRGEAVAKEVGVL